LNESGHIGTGNLVNKLPDSDHLLPEELGRNQSAVPPGEDPTNYGPSSAMRSLIRIRSDVRLSGVTNVICCSLRFLPCLHLQCNVCISVRSPLELLLTTQGFSRYVVVHHLLFTICSYRGNRNTIVEQKEKQGSQWGARGKHWLPWEEE
jgi:hypothetical protein